MMSPVSAQSSSVRTVLLVEDQTAIRQMLSAFVATIPGFCVVAECEQIDEAIMLVERHRPDVVVLDWTLREGSGRDFLVAMRGRPVAPGVLVFSGNAHPETVRCALTHGASGFVEKNASVSEFTTALEGVACGRTSLGPEVATALHTLVREASVPRSRITLTSREREILGLVAEGVSSRGIAERLGIGLRTVNTHRASLIRKTGLRAVAELTRYACEQGLVGVALARR